MSETFTAFVISEVEGRHKGAFRTISVADLPPHPVLVEVAYSTVNYKDGLATTGKGKIARKVPMIGGVDLSGTVIESSDVAWPAGTKVVVNGWGLSETEWGAYGRYIRVKPEWLTALPDAFSLEQAMGIGTAGYTAALAVDALEKWAPVKTGADYVVTGAAGGVGSFAVALLAKCGASVIAATGRPETQDYLTSIGAAGFIDRAQLSAAGAPLQKERWAGGIDSVGGPTLANILAQTARGSAIAACGLAASADLPGSVYPFILRGVSLLGIDSVYAPAEKRKSAYDRLARDLSPQLLGSMYEVHPFSALPELTSAIVEGKIRGRAVVSLI